MAKKWDYKAPGEILNYAFDWTPRNLGDAVITNQTAATESGTVVVESMELATDDQVTLYNASVTAKNARDGMSIPYAQNGRLTITWLSGGTVGETCEILLSIETDQGHTADQTVTIQVKAR